MNIDKILATYKGGGTSSFHPRMMLKVIVYGYTQKIYTNRRIAKAIREQIPFMWLSGGNRPDFRTIAHFRSSRLKGTIEEVFTSVMKLLLESNLVRLEDYYLDGTKLEANASRYSYVWKKSVNRYEAGLQAKLKVLLKEIDRQNKSEDLEYGDRDLEELGEDSHVSSDQIERLLTELEEKLSLRPKDKNLKKSVKVLKKDILPRQQKYENQREILGSRNSYSKTDPDATFMRMKEDHLKNGQLKPGYNIQIGVTDQFILHYSIHQSAGDASLLKPHIEGLRERYVFLPDRVIADAGYGSEENYEYLKGLGLEAFVKYPGFDREMKRKIKNDPYRRENLAYDAEKDAFICPNGKQIVFSYNRVRESKNGYKSLVSVYECEDCRGCPLKSKCFRGKGNRIINVNHRLDKLRKEARALLDSEIGQYYRRRRLAEVESVFAQIKNRDFRRFHVRGLDNVNMEFGLAHNFMKWAAILKKKYENSGIFLSLFTISKKPLLQFV